MNLSTVNSVREAVESFESIAEQYMHLNASKELLDWIGGVSLTWTSLSR